MPPRPGDEITLTVDTLAYGGRGVARHEGFVVFIAGAVPGDEVLARVTKRKRGYAEARLIEVVRPSEVRVPARCPHSAECGGCAWQTVSYEAQLAAKQQQVVESLEHIGGLTEFELEPIIGMDDPWRYRNKMEYSFGRGADGALLLGLHRRGSWREVVETDDCHLAPVAVNEARRAVADVCRQLDLRPYSSETHEGLLRHLVVRYAFATGDLVLNLFVRERFAAERELAARVAERRSFASFAVSVNEAPADAATGSGPYLIEGPAHFCEDLAGVHLRVPLTAFLQTNSVMCEQLYATALRGARPQAARPAYDLYCGIGGLTLLLARQAGTVYGMEVQSEAIDAAIVNARLNGSANVVFSAGDVRILLIDPPTGRPAPSDDDALETRRTTAAFDPPVVVVTDPPRAGMSKKALARAAALGAERFVYVSCNPTTLAADAAQLVEHGYRLTRVSPVDMFPHTHHVETVAVFERC